MSGSGPSPGVCVEVEFICRRIIWASPAFAQEYWDAYATWDPHELFDVRRRATDDAERLRAATAAARRTRPTSFAALAEKLRIAGTVSAALAATRCNGREDDLLILKGVALQFLTASPIELLTSFVGRRQAAEQGLIELTEADRPADSERRLRGMLMLLPLDSAWRPELSRDRRRLFS